MRRLGRFEIRQRLGAGAFGEVFRAFDPQLDRDVALKVPRSSVMQNRNVAKRFLVEARATARLTHPNIVPVFDAGQESGHHYIASAFINGCTLNDALEERLAFNDSTRIAMKLAAALGYAHEEGIIHRDVKPANVMLDQKGEPHLMDFGLARLEMGSDVETRDGTVLGTPAYMPPEQAAGDVQKITSASDQYSLGVTFYEMLCGERPFSGPTEVVIYNVINQDPPAPRSIRADVPRDLETICLKAISKDPEGRYQNCRALADDLRRFLNGEPVTARRIGWHERAIRWCRREPIMAGLAGAVMLALVAGSILSAMYAFEADKQRKNVVSAAHDLQRSVEEKESQRQRAELAERQAQAQLKAARRSTYNLQLTRAWETHGADPEAALRLLDDPENCPPHLRDFTWHLLRRASDCFEWRQPQDVLLSAVDFSADGRWIASRNGTKIRMWDRAGGGLKSTHELGKSTADKQLAELEVFTTNVTFTRDRQFITVSDQKTGRELHKIDISRSRHLTAKTDLGIQTGLSRDGSHFVVFGEYANKGSAAVYKTATARMLWEFPLSEISSGDLRHFIVSNDGETVAFLDRGTIGLRQTTGNSLSDAHPGITELRTPAGSPALALDFLEGRGQLVSAHADRTIRVWDIASRSLVRLWRTANTNHSKYLATSADGDQVAVGGGKSVLELWSIPSLWSRKIEFYGQAGPLRFSADGQRLLAHLTLDRAGGVVCVFDTQGGDSRHEVLTTPVNPSTPAVTKGKSKAAAVLYRLRMDKNRIPHLDSLNSEADTQSVESDVPRVYPVGPNRFPNSDQSTATGPRMLSIDPSGRFVACSVVKYVKTGEAIKNGRLTETRQPTRVTELSMLSGKRLGDLESTGVLLCFSEDGKRLAAVDVTKGSSSISFWDTATLRRLRKVAATGTRLQCLAFSPDGLSLAGGRDDGTISVWGVEDGTLRSSITGCAHPVYTLAYSPDGRTLASGGGEEFASGKPFRTVDEYDDTIGEVRLWDAQNGQARAQLPNQADIVRGIAFSPDGGTLATASDGGLITLFDARP